MSARAALGACLIAAVALTGAARAAPGAAAVGPVTVEVAVTGDGEGSLAARVIAAVEGASERLWMLAYTLSDPPLLEALAAKAATDGFDLRIVVDAERHEAALAAAKGKRIEEILRGLEEGGHLVALPVGGRGGSGRQHAKLMVIDDRTILLGSKNWSNLAGDTQLDALVILQDDGGALVVACREQIIRLGGDGFPAVRAALPRRRGAAPDAPGDAARAALYFASPGPSGGAARAAILDAIPRARRQVRVCQFMVTDPAIAQALHDRATRRNVELEVLVDRVQLENLGKRVDAPSRRAHEALAALQGQGHLRALGGSTQLHHKFAVIDDLFVIGSANWTPAAWGENHEVVLFLTPARPRDEPAYLTRLLAEHASIWDRAAP